MSKSYFSEYFRYQPDGTALHIRAYNVLHSLFQQEVEKGYSPREIAHVIHHTVLDLEMESVLDSRAAQKEQK